MIFKPLRFFALFVLLGLLSCKDDSDSYPISYHSAMVSETVSRVFTKDGELLDLAKKEDFVNRYGIYLEDILSKSIDSMINAVYISPETVLLHLYGADYFDTLSVVENSEMIYWEQKDTITRIWMSPTKDLYVYSPLYKEEFQIISMPKVYDAIYTKNCYFVIKDGGKLKFPIVGFFFKYRLDNSSTQIWGYTNNKFNVNAVDHFSTNDTILVNEFFYELKRS